MDQGKKLEQKVNEYSQIAKENPSVNAAMLMMNALESGRQNTVSSKAKRWAYLISIGAPPLGLLFALRYYMGDEDDGKEVAWICIILTILAALMFWLGAKLLLSGSGASVEQIQQIKPSDIFQLTQ